MLSKTDDTSRNRWIIHLGTWRGFHVEHDESSLELLTEHRKIDVKVDMRSLIAQASCAEQNGGNTV